MTLKKLFNEREGWTRAEDTLPARFLSEPLPERPEASLSRRDLDRMIASYYRARGWAEDGRVPASRAATLGLEWPGLRSS